MNSTISLKSYLVNAYLDQRRRRMHASYDRLDETMLLIVMMMMIDVMVRMMITMMIVKNTYIHTNIL